MKTFVLYHGGGCADGFGAAWCANRAMGDAAEYVPVQYGKPIPDMPDGSHVYILDFSYPRGELLALAARMEKVVVLDHHRSARLELDPIIGNVPNLSITFDESKSGAVLAWEYFYPVLPILKMIQYIQDRDLWTWNLPASKEVSAYIALEPKTFPHWDLLEKYISDSETFDDITIAGLSILRAKESYVATLAAYPQFVSVGGYRVAAVNSPLFQSELGERLCELYPEGNFGAVYFINENGDEVWSLRSRNGFDVSKVAKDYGGCGHRAAAGFTRARKC